MGVLTEYRRRLLGTWLDWGAFRRDRRLILRYPGKIGAKKRPLKNAPLQFFLHALIPATALAWIVESAVVAFGDLPPTSFERLLDEYRAVAQQADLRGVADLAAADSTLATAPEWLVGLDSTHLRLVGEDLEGRLAPILSLVPDESAVAALEAEEHARSDSLARLARETPTRDAVLQWLAARERADAAMARHRAALDTSIAILRHANALTDSLVQVERVRAAVATREVGLTERGMMDDYRRAQLRHEASDRSDALLGRFRGVLVLTSVLLNALMFGFVISRVYPSADRDAASLYLYSAGATLLWPNVAYQAWVILSDLGDRLQWAWPWYVDAVIHGAAVALGLFALARAAGIIAEAMLRRDQLIDRQGAEVRVLLVLVGCQLATAVGVVALGEGVAAAYQWGLAQGLG